MDAGLRGQWPSCLPRLLEYDFRKSERPVLTVQGIDYLNKSGRVQTLISGNKPGITSGRCCIMYEI